MDGFRNPWAIRTHAEIATIMCARGVPMTTRQVWHDEHRAVLKLRAALRGCFVEMCPQAVTGEGAPRSAATYTVVR